MDRVQRQHLQSQLTRLAQGDRDAFHPVFILLWPLLRGFTARALARPDADDVAQEAPLKVFRRAAEFDPARDALSWALGIAAFEVKTARRKHQRRREEPTEAGWLEGLPDRAAGPEELLAASCWRGRAGPTSGGGLRRPCPPRP